MRKILTIILAAVICCCMSARDFKELPAELDGSMTLYDFSSVEPRLIPDSLTPVYISYVARHGARYLTSENKVKACEKWLSEARKRGSMTPAGESFLRLLNRVREATDGQWGMLSPIGKEEELRLGRELAGMFPEVFSAKDAEVASVASYVPRVIETMDQFTIAIADENQGILTHASSGKAYDRLTRFFVTDSLYNAWRLNGEWKEVYERFVAENLPLRPALQLVGADSGLSDKELRKLTYDMYKVLQGMRASGLPAPTEEWMTPEEYRACWEATNLEKYFQYSISSLSTVPAAGARDLLDYLLTIETRLATGRLSPGLDGIFGHAETLLPFFSLIGVPGTSAFPLDWEQLAGEWSDARLTPLGANLAIIYSRSASGRLYASMRLNGRNVSPVNDPKRLTVPLGELHSYWLERLDQLHLPR